MSDPLERRAQLLDELAEISDRWRETHAEFMALEPWADPLPPDVVRRIRLALGYTQEQMAAVCGYSRGMSISDLETGNHRCSGPIRRVMIMLFERFNSEVSRAGR